MASFEQYQEDFKLLLGESPRLEKLIEKDYPFAFEAGIYIPQTNELFVTSLPLADSKGRLNHEISKITLEDGNVRSTTIPCDGIEMANGGVNYKDGMLFCAQGSIDNPSGLFYISSKPPYKSELVIADFYGRPFNSINDVVVHSDGTIWFTDPAYGFGEGYRPPPRLPNQVYRHNPITGSTRVVADGFGHPNGLCFSPDESILYITDTDQVWGDGSVDESRASTIYAFDVKNYSGEPFLVNRRLFAMPDTGFPDGIKCDLGGNVYSGCGDGVNVWSPGGSLIGKIKVGGMVANFCFGRGGELFLLTGKVVWRATLADTVRGALLRI